MEFPDELEFMHRHLLGSQLLSGGNGHFYDVDSWNNRILPYPDATGRKRRSSYLPRRLCGSTFVIEVTSPTRFIQVVVTAHPLEPTPRESSGVAIDR